jgi:transporter family-2 protein
MQALPLIILIGLAGGVAAGLQTPLVSLISQRLGILESAFIVHLSGAVISLIPLLLLGGGNLAQWRTLPWYALGTGVFGLTVIASISYLIPRVGIAAAITAIVAGQLLIGALLDHFGFLGASVRSLDPARLVGLLVVLAGVWLTVR